MCVFLMMSRMSSSSFCEALRPVENTDCVEWGTHMAYAAMKSATAVVFPKRRGVRHRTD